MSESEYFDELFYVKFCKVLKILLKYVCQPRFRTRALNVIHNM